MKLNMLSRKIIEQEMTNFRSYVYGKNLTYTTYLYNEMQTKGLCKRINEKVKGWEADWYYDLHSKVYVIECRRGR